MASVASEAVSRVEDLPWRGERVSRMVLGTAQLGMAYGIANRAGKPSDDAAHAIVAAACECGIRFFDTAQAYGDSERTLGAAVPPEMRGHACVISKLAPQVEDGERIGAVVEESLRLLHVGQLWGMLLHRPGPLDARRRSLLEELARQRDHGRLRFIGTSVYSVSEAIESLHHPLVDIVQIPCNAWDQRMVDGRVFELAAELGKLCFVRSIYLQGLLTLSPEQVQNRMPAAAEAARRWQQLANELECTPIHLAARFAAGLKLPLVIGAETPDQVARNVALLSQPPLEETAARMVRERIEPVVDATIVDPSRWPKPS